MAIDTKKAAEELGKFNLHQIQVTTAYTWASRAWVAYNNFNKSKDVRWYNDAQEYFHEALEHAALAESKQKGLLKEIHDKVLPVQKESELIIRKKSFV